MTVEGVRPLRWSAPEILFDEHACKQTSKEPAGREKKISYMKRKRKGGEEITKKKKKKKKWK